MVTDFGTNRKLIYDFLSVISINLPASLHRLRYIAFEMSKIAIHLATPFAFKPPDGGFSWDDLRKMFSEGQRMAMVPNGIEILRTISTR